MKLITLITLMPIDSTEERYFTLSPAAGYKSATCSVSGVALLVLIQHEASIVEEMLSEVKLAVIGYGAAKKAPGDEMARRL